MWGKHLRQKRYHFRPLVKTTSPSNYNFKGLDNNFELRFQQCISIEFLSFQLINENNFTNFLCDYFLHCASLSMEIIYLLFSIN